MEMTDFRIQLKLLDGDGAAKAVADVTLLLGSLGEVQLCGIRVIESNGEPWVAMPSRKGEKKYFPIIRLIGPLRKIIVTAVLKEFAQRTAASK